MKQNILPLQNEFSEKDIVVFAQKNNYNGVDVMKFLCAFLVCAIHIPPFPRELAGINLLFWLQSTVCRVAVPFFFVCAGFFLFNKIDTEKPDMGLIKNYCFKIARMLGIWSFLLFVGSKGQLWYLGGLFVAVLVLGFLFSFKVKLKYACLIALLLYAIGLLGDAYYGFLKPLQNYTITNAIISWYYDLFGTTRNGLFFGLPFVLMGVLFAKIKIKIPCLVAALGFILSLAALCLEVYALANFSSPKDYNMTLCLMPTTFFLFYFCSNIKLKNRKIYVKLRIYSILIFFLHLFIYYFVNIALTVIKNNFGINLLTYMFWFVAAISLLVAICIEKLSRTKSFRWLKYLYS